MVGPDGNHLGDPQDFDFVLRLGLGQSADSFISLD